MQRFWRITACGIALVVMLGACAKSGGNGSSDGASVYQTNCSSCHGANGQGMPGSFPPLAGNLVVTGDPAKLIKIVKGGLSGKITVGGHDFSGEMPAWSGRLSAADIAAAITYVRSSWGNNASAVTESQVSGASP
jgi:mono/diheme cytochrome c family protein